MPTLLRTKAWFTHGRTVRAGGPVTWKTSSRPSPETLVLPLVFMTFRKGSPCTQGPSCFHRAARAVGMSAWDLLQDGQPETEADRDA